MLLRRRIAGRGLRLFGLMAMALIASIGFATAGPVDDTAGPTAYKAMLKREAEAAGLPADVADAVMAIESGYDPTKIGGVGEIGLMQVRPTTAAMLGFTGSEIDLAKPDINIRYGVKYLAQAWRLSSGDICRALMKYRAGHGQDTMSPLSVSYCQRARAHLVSINSPLATLVPDLPPMAGFATSQPARPGGRGYWATRDALVRAIAVRIAQRRRLVAQQSRSKPDDRQIVNRIKALDDQVLGLNEQLERAGTARSAVTPATKIALQKP